MKGLYQGYDGVMGFYDPYRFGLRPAPIPVEGELPPPLRLVEEDDDLLCHRTSAQRRVMAGLVALLFAVATAFTAYQTAGLRSLLTQAGFHPPPPADSRLAP